MTFLVGMKLLGAGREEMETAMQEVVNQGVCNWTVNTELNEWDDTQKGLLYVFQKPL